MKAEINLLPLQFQAARHAQRYRHGLEYMLRWLLAALAVVAIMFGGSYVFFRQGAAGIQVTQQETDTSQELEQRVIQTNELLAAVDARLRTTTPWTPHIGEILRALPPELTLISIAVSDESKDLTIEGTSRSRTAILAFEQAVKKLPWVASVESPLQNFTTGSTSFTLIIKRDDTP